MAKARQVESAIVEFQLAPFDQLKNGRGRDGLADAGNAEQSVRIDRKMPCDIGVTEAARIDDAAMPRDGQRRAGNIVLFKKRDHQAVERREFRVLLTCQWHVIT